MSEYFRLASSQLFILALKGGLRGLMAFKTGYEDRQKQLGGWRRGQSGGLAVGRGGHAVADQWYEPDEHRYRLPVCGARACAGAGCDFRCGHPPQIEIDITPLSHPLHGEPRGVFF